MSIKCARLEVEQQFNVRVHKNSLKSIRGALRKQGIPNIYDIKAMLPHATQNDLPWLARYLGLPRGTNTLESIRKHIGGLYLLADSPASIVHARDIQHECTTHSHKTRFDIARRVTETTSCGPRAIPVTMSSPGVPSKPVPFVYGQNNTILIVGYGVSTSAQYPRLCNERSQISHLLVCDLTLEVTGDGSTGKWFSNMLQEKKGDAKRARGAAQVSTGADLHTTPLGVSLAMDSRKMVLKHPWNIDYLQNYTSRQVRHFPVVAKIQKTVNSSVTPQTAIDDTFPPFITCTTGDRVAAPIPLLFKTASTMTLWTLDEFQLMQPTDVRGIKFMTEQERLSVCEVPNKQEDYSQTP